MMRTQKDARIFYLLFLFPVLMLVTVPLRGAVEAAQQRRRTQALVTYVQKNQCGDSSDSCYIQEINWLIENGADLNALMPNGEPIMRWCAKAGAYDIAQQLQRAGARPDAITQGIIWRMYRSNLSDQMFNAIDTDEVASLRSAIASGADVNGTDDNGDTPLMKAIETQDSSLVQLLLSRGARVRARRGETALRPPVLSHSLLHGGEPQTLSLLKAAEAPSTPIIDFFIAVIQNRPREVQRGLQTGIDVNTTNNGANDKWTPLMWAASYGHPEVVRLLLSYGADPLIKDRRGRIAISYAKGHYGDYGSQKKQQRLQIVEMLKAAVSSKQSSSSKRSASRRRPSKSVPATAGAFSLGARQ